MSVETVDNNGYEIAFERTDWRAPWSQREPWLLLVHGLHSSREHWYAQVPRLAQHYRVLTLDLRGHGDAAKASSYTIDDYVSDVAAVCEAVGVESAHVVGASAGGFVAQDLARTMPEVVRSITLAGTGARVPGGFDPDTLTAGVKGQGINAFFREFAKGNTFAPSVSPELFEFVMGMMLSDPEDLIMQRISEGLTWDGLELAADIECPTLVITGEYDGTFPVESSVELWRAIEQADLAIIPDCGHLPHLEEPDIFADLLLRFLSSVERDGR